jgi:hypothetical protein
MEYLTTSEAAEKWNISRRRVNVLCYEGRIKGAIKKGRFWLIPDNVPKPIDGRTVRYESNVKQ